jgi:transcription initiation factor TFIIB
MMSLETEHLMSAREHCGECGSRRLIWDSKRGEVICSECGLVVEDGMLDRGPEWRSFQGDDSWKRIRGGPPLRFGLGDRGLSTQISVWDRDSSGNTLDSRAASRFHRLRKWDRRKKRRVDRRITYGLTDLSRISAQLQIPRGVKEAACLIFRRLVEKGFTRGKNTERVTASVIYIACRQAGVPRILAEVTKFTKARKKQIARTYKDIVKELGIHLPPISPVELIPRFASRINLPGWVAERAIHLIEEEMKLGPFSATTPGGTAAAALYISSIKNGFRYSQREISRAAHTTEVTLRKRVRDILEHLDIELGSPAGHSTASPKGAYS